MLKINLALPSLFVSLRLNQNLKPKLGADKKIEKKYVETPLMKQYYDIKAVHPDAILLFRVGDFYETFGQDAIKASGILGITRLRGAPTDRHRMSSWPDFRTMP